MVLNDRKWLRQRTRVIKLLGLIAIISALPGCMSSNAQNDSIEGIERQRFAAMERQDIEVLSSMVANDLTYCHANGTCQSKEQFLEMIRSGSTRYRSVEVKTMRTRLFADCGVITGTIDVDAEINAKPVKLLLAYTDVYIRKNEQWQLVAWHSSAIPQPNR